MKGVNGFMFTKDDTLKAVYSTELDSLLEKPGVLELFRNGEIKCRYCNKTISKNNLYAMVPVNSSIEFCCSESSCILSLAKEAN